MNQMNFNRMQYFNVVFHEEEDGGYSASVPSLPGCFSQGDNFEEARKNITEAIDLFLREEPDKESYLAYARQKEFIAPIEIPVYA